MANRVELERNNVIVTVDNGGLSDPEGGVRVYVTPKQALDLRNALDDALDAWECIAGPVGNVKREVPRFTSLADAKAHAATLAQGFTTPQALAQAVDPYADTGPAVE